MQAPARRPRRAPTLAACAAAMLLASACSSLEFKRDTQTSGTFTSCGWAFTILSFDIPKTAEQIARENASDANLANTQVTDVLVVPWLGPLDWIFDILGVRYCRIDGTWGFPGPVERGESASPGSKPGS
ncbi:MAG: hypothetical protein HZA53_04430 [Planctomycetes bacterium]|nr:hypothetical protein [Planctomycetota bacterium]